MNSIFLDPNDHNCKINWELVILGWVRHIRSFKFSLFYLAWSLRTSFVWITSMFFAQLSPYLDQHIDRSQIFSTIKNIQIFKDLRPQEPTPCTLLHQCLYLISSSYLGNLCMSMSRLVHLFCLKLDNSLCIAIGHKSTSRLAGDCVHHLFIHDAKKWDS